MAQNLLGHADAMHSQRPSIVHPSSPPREGAKLQPTSRGLVRRALDEHLFELALQPVLDRGGALFGYEALLRTRLSDLGSPLQALREAEAGGMLPELSSRIFALAADCIASLPDPVKLFVNVHPAELIDPVSFRARLQPLLPFAHRVSLELTERSRTSSCPRWPESLMMARASGFALALSDLGASTEALPIIRTIVPDFIKLDRTLVRDIDRHPRKRRVAELLCSVAGLIGSVAVAERVEKPDEASALRQCGVSLFQGYLFGRPAPAASRSIPRVASA